MSNINELNIKVTVTSPTVLTSNVTANLAEIIEAGDDVYIPPVTNIKVDEYGLLTFDEPDISKLEKFSPVLSYIITVNGTEIQSTTNSLSILNILVDGDNIIDVKVKALLTTYSENVEEVVEYEKPPYTDPSLFSYRSVTINGVEGWEVTAYNGTDESISIPPYNTDGLPILSLYDVKNSSCKNVTGLFIKNVVYDNFRMKNVETISLPALEMTKMNETFRLMDSLITIKELNTSKTIEMANTFLQCKSLKNFPLIDTRNLKSMYMTFAKTPLEEIPLFDMSNVEKAQYVFQETKLKTIPQFNTAKLENMDGFLGNCPLLESIPLLDLSNVTNANGAFSSCKSLKSIPEFNTSKLQNASNLFAGCSSLTSIPRLNFSKVNSLYHVVYNCTSLKEFLPYGMKVSFDLSSSTKFERENLVTVLNNLATVTTTQTLTLGEVNLAKLTDEDKKIATDKGWTLA